MGALAPSLAAIAIALGGAAVAARWVGSARATPAGASCAALVEQGAHEAAAARCASEFAAARDQASGLALVEVLHHLGRGDEASAVVAQLPDPLFGRLTQARLSDPRRALALASDVMVDAVTRSLPDHVAFAAFIQASALKELGRYADAERALDLAGTHIPAQLARMNLLRTAGDFDEALRLGQQAIEEAGKLPDAPSETVRDVQLQVALANIEAGRFGPAAGALREFLAAEQTPDRADAAYLNLAFIHKERDQCAHAALYLYLARLNAGVTSEGAMLAGEVALRCGLVRAARPWLDVAAAVPDPGKWRARVETSLGDLAAREGDRAAAEQHYAVALAEAERVRAGGGALGPVVAGKLLEPYEHALDLAASRGDWRTALALVLRHEAGAPDHAPVDATLAAWRGRTLVVFVRGWQRVWRLDVVDGQVTGADLGKVEPLVALDLLDEHADKAQRINARLGAGLPTATRVHVNLIGDLALVPIAALRDGNARLLEHAALLRVVRIAPSLPLVGAHNPSTTSPSANLAPDASANVRVVLGDPLATSAPADPASATTVGLAGARAEAIWVAEQLGVAPRLGPAATRAALAAARGAGVLHVAGHATWTLEGPRLPLADGEVGAAEIADLAPAPRLVVLASCFSARARDRNGFTSLAAAFVAAGAAMVISTQTSVDDRAARKLIEAFYTHGGVADPAEALRQAQLELAAAGVDPHEWATFVAIAAPPPAP